MSTIERVTTEPQTTNSGQELGKSVTSKEFKDCLCSVGAAENKGTEEGAVRNVRTTSESCRTRNRRANDHKENARRVGNHARNVAGDSTRAAANYSTGTMQSRGENDSDDPEKRARRSAPHSRTRISANTFEQDSHILKFCTHSAGTRGHQEQCTRPTRAYASVPT